MLFAVGNPLDVVIFVEVQCNELYVINVTATPR